MNENLKKRFIFYPILLTLLVGSVLWMKHMPGESFKGKASPLTQAQIEVSSNYKEQVNTYAKEPRNYIHFKNLQKTEVFLIEHLKSNLKVENSINEQLYLNKYKNIEMVIEPKEKATQTVVIGAHYDSEENSPGADDNFSSVVILLELAKRFNQKFESKNTRVRVVFFTNEEPPFFKSDQMGSVVYANMLAEKKENVTAMYAFDMLGYFTEEENSQNYPLIFTPFFPDKGNFVAFISNINSRDLLQESIYAFRENAQMSSEGVSAPTYITGIDFSDHSSFYNHNWKAIMITDTAFNRNPHYHKASDTPDKLNYDKMAVLTDDLEEMFRKIYEK